MNSIKKRFERRYIADLVNNNLNRIQSSFDTVRANGANSRDIEPFSAR